MHRNRKFPWISVKGSRKIYRKPYKFRDNTKLSVKIKKLPWRNNGDWPSNL